MLYETLQKVFGKDADKIGFSSDPLSLFIECFFALMYSASLTLCFMP